MSKGEAAEAGTSASAQEGREPKNRRNILVHRHRSCSPTEINKAEGMRAEYREDGDGAASSTAQAASRRYLAATEGPGGSGTAGSRRRFNSDLGLERRKQAAKARKKHKRAAARMASET